MIWNRDSLIRIDDELEGRAMADVIDIDDKHIIVRLSRISDASLLPPDSFRDRLRDVLNTLGDVAARQHRDDWFIRQYCRSEVYAAKVYAAYATKLVRQWLNTRMTT